MYVVECENQNCPHFDSFIVNITNVLQLIHYYIIRMKFEHVGRTDSRTDHDTRFHQALINSFLDQNDKRK